MVQSIEPDSVGTMSGRDKIKAEPRGARANNLEDNFVLKDI